MLFEISLSHLLEFQVQTVIRIVMYAPLLKFMEIRCKGNHKSVSLRYLSSAAIKDMVYVWMRISSEVAVVHIIGEHTFQSFSQYPRHTFLSVISFHPVWQSLMLKVLLLCNL